MTTNVKIRSVDPQSPLLFADVTIWDEFPRDHNSVNLDIFIIYPEVFIT